MSDQYVGEIRMVGFNFAPTGWALCDGQLLPIAQNQALFSLLGTYYGGDGETDFGLPNLQGRVPVNMGTLGGTSYAIGEETGSATASIEVANLPSHSHGVSVGAGQTTDNPSNALLAQNGAYASGTGTGTAAAGFIEQTGGSQPISLLQPLLVVNFIISTTGIFPTRAT